MCTRVCAVPTDRPYVSTALSLMSLTSTAQVWPNVQIFFLNKIFRGAWVAQSVKCPTLDLGSGHDLTVREFKPHIRLCTDSVEPAWDSISPSLCPSFTVHTRSHARSLSQIKRKRKKEKKGREGGREREKEKKETWVAQSVERPTSARVVVSRFVGLSTMSGSVLTAQSLEPASDSVCAFPACTLSLSKIIEH